MFKHPCKRLYLGFKNLKMGKNNERIIVLLQGYQQGCLKLL
jgi:hypothetical protein